MKVLAEIKVGDWCRISRPGSRTIRAVYLGTDPVTGRHARVRRVEGGTEVHPYSRLHPLTPAQAGKGE